jgi:hypothetical protein
LLLSDWMDFEVEDSFLHDHGPQAWRKSGYWKILQGRGWHMLGRRSMTILSHVHGPQAWRKSGYWKILQGFGWQMLGRRSMMILSHVHGPQAWSRSGYLPQ